jgi:hypothetical protein
MPKKYQQVESTDKPLSVVFKSADKQEGVDLHVEWFAKCLEPTEEVTSAQAIWVTTHTIIASILCFGVNFAVCVLTFKGKDDPKMWDFPTPIWGTYAITIFLEITLNYFINGYLFTLDVKNGKVAPLLPSAIWWYPESDYWRWWLDLGGLCLPMTSRNSSFCWQVFYMHLRSLVWMGYAFLVLLPGSIAITYALYGEDNYNDFPQPQILVGLFGVLLALFTIPIWALMSLVQVGIAMTETRYNQTLLV